MIEQPDKNVDHIYSIYNAYIQDLRLTEHFKLRLRLGGYLMHHKNKHHYNSGFSKSLKPALDNAYFNTRANAAIIEPNIQLTYTQATDWGKWRVTSDLNYLIGRVYSGSKAIVGATPEGVRLNNGVKLHFDIHNNPFDAESIYLNLQRTDMHGDMTNSFQTDHFYTMGLGILFDTHKFKDLVKNMGVGLNLNVGTSLSGGSIVFYFNEF